MSRPRNDKLKEEILKESWQQFRKYGYNGTTYTKIAEACGISRNLVQYHFPKKELLSVAFMERVMAEAQRSLGISEEELHGNFRAFYEVIYCFFAFLLQENGYRKFLQDIILSRERTEKIFAFNLSWTLERIDLPADADLEPIYQEMIVILGGFCELMYYCLQHNKPFATGKHLAEFAEHFEKSIAKAAGSSISEPTIFFDEELEQVVSRAVLKMNHRFDIR
ncbi:MAG: TetR/AcrR family transcriptional regulator [Coriobacteriales bacterium]|jgi:AcrR family transcriptional regulator